MCACQVRHLVNPQSNHLSPEILAIIEGDSSSDQEFCHTLTQLSAVMVAQVGAVAHRSTLTQVLNDVRTGEVELDAAPDQYDALCAVFQAALTHCETQKDVKNGRQLMVMSDTFYRLRKTGPAGSAGGEGGGGAGKGGAGADDAMGTNGENGNHTSTSATEAGAGAGAGASGAPDSDAGNTSSNAEGEGKPTSKPEEARRARAEQRRLARAGRQYIQESVAGHSLWGQKWFWEELLLMGVSSEFELSPPEVGHR